MSDNEGLAYLPSRPHSEAITWSLTEHQIAWQRYSDIPVNTTLDLTDKENQFSDEWQRDHYFVVGEEALRQVMVTLLVNRRPMPARILDFPSGSGRVTRHLRAMFPDAEIGACDLYPSHVEFCVNHFGATPLHSRENLDELDVGKWDLIFCGSLLTHLPAAQFSQALDFMVRSLAPNGIAIVTLEGRRSVFIQDNMWKLIDDDLFKVAREGYELNGFGYVDYAHDFLTGNFGNQESYGVTLIKPACILAMLQEMDDVAILSFQEGAWDEHQDIVIFGKPGIKV